MRLTLTATMAVGLCLLAGIAVAATTVGSLEPAGGTWRAYRGSDYATLVCSANSEAAVLACAAADAGRRAATTRYQIRYPNRYATVTYSVPTAPNRAPTISGTPAGTGQVGVVYRFQPSASDADGNALTFSIQRRPRWATFSTTTGELVGTPTADDVAYHSDIAISVSDGRASASLPEFSIAVRAALSTPTPTTPPQPQPGGTGLATLSWTPPTKNVDGTALTDLAGYRISYGTSPTALVQAVQVAVRGATAYTIGNLAPGTYFFTVRAYTSDGDESAQSGVVSKVVL